MNLSEDKNINLSARYSNFSNGHGNIKIHYAILVGLILMSMILTFTYSCLYFWPYLHQMFFERGIIPYFITFLFSFSISILIYKYRWLKTEQKVYNKKQIQIIEQTGKFPNSKIEPDNNEQHSILLNRINNATKRYRLTNSVSDVDEIIKSISDMDVDIVESSYLLINYLTWVIPILGFLGTVIGVGSAIGGFGTIIDSAGSGGFEAIRNNIGVVTDNLSLAFDTTLIALIYSAIVMFLTSLQKKQDEDFLSGVDNFCYEHLLSNLKTQLQNNQAPAVPDQSNTNQQILLTLKEMNQSLKRTNDSSLENTIKQINRLLESNKEIVNFENDLKQLVNVNSEMVKAIPQTMNNLRTEIEKMSKLFSKIYNVTL
jgi:biopolymer transport protein ExbB/TolQ